MKRLLTTWIVFWVCLAAFAQEGLKIVMEKRVKEMHRVIQLNEREQWKKFIVENYTQTFIDKPMRSKIQTSTPDGAQSDADREVKSKGNLEAKIAMFNQFHSDFGNSKILSIKPVGEKLEMILENSNGTNGKFLFTFEKEKPYLIDGLGIEIRSDL